MKFKNVLMSIVVAIVMVGCASQSPVRVNGKLIDKPNGVDGIAGTEWQLGTIASWRITPADKVLVCLDQGCNSKAPETLRRAIEKRGIQTAQDLQDAAYTLSIRGFVTTKVSNKDGEQIVAPLYAMPLVGAEQASGVKVSPWIGDGNEPGDMRRKGMTAFGLLTKDIRVYDTLWHQTGQLTQTIGGGSPGAYLAGFLLAPILDAVGVAKAKNDLREGLAGVEMTFMPAHASFKTIRTVYGFAASTREESPEDLAAAALDEAMASAHSFVERAKQEDGQTTQRKEGGEKGEEKEMG